MVTIHISMSFLPIFILLQLDTLERGQLASRLTLNCNDNYVEPQKLQDIYITIMDVRKLRSLMTGLHGASSVRLINAWIHRPIIILLYRAYVSVPKSFLLSRLATCVLTTCALFLKTMYVHLR